MADRKPPTRRAPVFGHLFLVGGALLIAAYLALAAVGFPLAPLVLGGVLAAFWESAKAYGWADGYLAAEQNRADE